MKRQTLPVITARASIYTYKIPLSLCCPSRTPDDASRPVCPTYRVTRPRQSSQSSNRVASNDSTVRDNWHTQRCRNRIRILSTRSNDEYSTNGRRERGWFAGLCRDRGWWVTELAGWLWRRNRRSRSTSWY